MALPAIIPRASMPTTHRHETALLVQDDELTKYSKLLPADVLRRVVGEIERALSPIGEEGALRWARELVGAYPKREVNDPDIYMRSLRFDLQEFPPDIVERTVHEVRRTCKFLPACAEVYQVAKRHLNERNFLLRRARMQLEEHERRRNRPKPTGKMYRDLSPEERREFQARIEAIRKGAADGMRPDYPRAAGKSAVPGR